MKEPPRAIVSWIGSPRRDLRPPRLPHHRTYGFPYPAIEDGRGLTREVGWCNKPISLEDVVAEGFLQHGVSRHAPGSATTMRHISS